MFIRRKPEPLKALGLIILLTCLVFASWALLHRSPLPAKDVYPYLLGISPELVEELDRLALPFAADQAPTDAELRIAQAQLVGWLEGLFHGIQTALFAQQMAARAQLEQMRRALPPGMTPGQDPQRRGQDQGNSSGGMYL